MKNIKITLGLIFVFLCTSNIYGKKNPENNEIKTISWMVKTNKSNYSGTSNSIEEAQKSIDLITLGEKVISTSYFETDVPDIDEISLYKWVVETENKTIQGTSFTYKHALNCIKTISKNKKIHSKLIVKRDF